MIHCQEVKSWTLSTGERLVVCDQDGCAKHAKLRRAVLCGDATIASVRPVRDRDLSETLLRQQLAAREEGDDVPIEEHDKQAHELGTPGDFAQELDGELSWQSLRGTTQPDNGEDRVSQDAEEFSADDAPMFSAESEVMRDIDQESAYE
jgi:hypothetical protein